MIDFFYGIGYYLASIFFSGNKWQLAYAFFPFIFLLELPFTMITIIYAIRAWLNIQYKGNSLVHCNLMVTMIITAYSETENEISITLRTIHEQIYPGIIEVLFIVDNAKMNQNTVKAARNLIKKMGYKPNRHYKIIEKKERGGLASSRNLGLQLAKGDIIIAMDADTSVDNQSIAQAAKHFLDKNVIAVSGAIRVRNIFTSITTRFQAIEYMTSIQLGRFGLTELQVTNNISGCYGIFRTNFLRQIGGWLNGTAEDLDLTLRLHVLMGLYPELKIVHEPYSIAWTNAPTNFKQLLKQRLRWDGDLYYIYVRRHWRKFSTRIISPVKMLFFSLYALYYQLVLPFIILTYLIYILYKYNLPFVAGIFILIYLYYLILSMFTFMLFLLLVSERPKQDIKLIGWAILYPAYNMVMRFMALFFILNEIIFKGHKDTSMAPYWVIRKTK